MGDSQHVLGTIDAACICSQAVATQEAATQSPPKKDTNEFMLQTLTLWLLKVRPMPSSKANAIDVLATPVLTSRSCGCMLLDILLNLTPVHALTGRAGGQD